MPYMSTKTFCHAAGLSCCFRQWRATHSHCQYLHGYAIEVKLSFMANQLDDKNWVQDFGGFAQLKEFLKFNFDHKTIVASDDPQLNLFLTMDSQGLCDLIILENVGCEAFAKIIFEKAVELYQTDRVKVNSCEVKEHGANSAIYYECH